MNLGNNPQLARWGQEMDLEKLEKTAKLFLNEIPKGHSLLEYNSAFAAKFSNLMQAASQVLPDHQALFMSAVSKINSSFTLSDAESITWRLLDILETRNIERDKHQRLKFNPLRLEKSNLLATVF